MQFDSTDYLTEYYDVSYEKAIELGTRSAGRKPDLPASKTCRAVSNMTMEDIWDSKERKTQKDIFDFYVDQGAWSAFRQCVRHRELINLHLSIVKSFVKDGMHICEYGCGVAPFSFTLCNIVDTHVGLDISLSDIDGCEHLLFGDWRLNRLKEDRGLSGVNIHTCPVHPDKLPQYGKKIDLAIAFEIFEHIPSPIRTLSNLMKQMNPKGCLIENFIYHEPTSDDDDLRNDLPSAATERAQYYDILRFNFNLVGGNSPTADPNGLRIWQLKV